MLGFPAGSERHQAFGGVLVCSADVGALGQTLLRTLVPTLLDSPLLCTGSWGLQEYSASSRLQQDGMDG